MRTPLGSELRSSYCCWRGAGQAAGTYQFGACGLDEVTRRHPPAEMMDVPGLVVLADRVRKRILDVETARGDLATLLNRPADADAA